MHEIETSIQESAMRRPVLTRETLVPWSAVVAIFLLAWFGFSKYGDLEKQIKDNAALQAKEALEQSKDVALQIQALTFQVQAQSEELNRQGRDLLEVKKSVEALSLVGRK